MCHNNTNDTKFRNIGSPDRVWAVPAIHSETQNLIELHDFILSNFKRGDKIVYLGNYTGYRKNAISCLDEILTFRRLILSISGIIPSDITYLRGSQEEMWQKLLQIQFAPDPTNVLLWMLGHGLSSTLESYGVSPHDGIDACRKGTLSLTKWTDEIRTALRKHGGHETFNSQLLRAAHTDKTAQYPILFVHSGLNAALPLSEQGDNLWWGSDDFIAIDEKYKPFEKVVRGYDPTHGGIKLNCITATIDGGCGFGGPLVCTGFDQDGKILEMPHS